jgi:CHAT domain-containing protein
VLTGAAATKAAFLAKSPQFDVVHFGGHAFTNTEFPLLSRLEFSSAPQRAPVSVFAWELAALRLPRTHLVVLAACSTALGDLSLGEGAISVARPFLANGVPVVIASQWDVDDEATQRLFVAFHESLAKLRDPVQALRAAQLRMIRDADTRYTSPGSWGAFVALGYDNAGRSLN